MPEGQGIFSYLERRSSYWRALSNIRRTAGKAVFVQVAAGCVESFALAAVIPLLYAGQSLENEQGRFARLIKSLGLTGTKGTMVVLGLFVFLGLAATYLRFLGDKKMLRLRNQVEASMRKRMTMALLKMDWSSFLSLRLGDISQAVLLEGHETAAGIQAIAIGMSELLISMVFLLLALFISPALTILTLTFGVMAGIGYRRMGALAEARGKEWSEAAGVIGQQVNDFFGNLKFFRSTGGTQITRAKALDTFKSYADTVYQAQIYGPLMRLSFEGLALVFVGAILATALITKGALTPESLVFLAVFYRLAPRILKLQQSFQTARSIRPWFHRWEERMAIAEENAESHLGRQTPSFERAIRFESVEYVYPGTEVQVVKDVGLTITQGETVAFVGGSGAGKTTLLDIITGLLTPTGGRVLVDDVPLSEIDREQWQNQIGLVMQESPLFHTTIVENIAWLAPTTDPVRAMRCAEAAFADEFINALPDGLNTVIGEKGGKLSGGQRQRLALARALYRDPWLLVLDEATSALDSASEEIVQKALLEQKGRRTIVMVAHRLKTVEIADRIIVMANGAIVEEGTWTELLGRDGYFAEMAARQGISAQDPSLS